jgi:rubredoxin
MIDLKFICPNCRLNLENNGYHIFERKDIEGIQHYHIWITCPKCKFKRTVELV